MRDNREPIGVARRDYFCLGEACFAANSRRSRLRAGRTREGVSQGAAATGSNGLLRPKFLLSSDLVF